MSQLALLRPAPPDFRAFPREIALLEESRRLIAEARTIDEVKTIRDQAEAIRMYLKQRGAGLEIQNTAAEIKLRAERRAGEILSVMEKRDGGDAARARLHPATEIPPSLKDLGIEKTQSHRWQRIFADIPEEVFEAHIADTQAAGTELTTAGVLRLANQSRPRPERPAWTLDDAIDELGRTAYLILRRWPPDYVPVMIHQLRALADELERSGDLCP